MAVTLQLMLASGEVAYISKHNSNYTAIEAMLNAMETQVTTLASSTLSLGKIQQGLFGTTDAMIGSTAYQPTVNGNTLDVASGFAWLATDGKVVNKASSTNISFVGAAADTYYIVLDALGEPTRQTTSTNAIWSVDWDGASVFSNITRVASVAWGDATFQAAQTSTALGNQTYLELDARLEAGESAAVGLIGKTVAGTDITLTTPEAMENQTIHLTGAQSADIDLIVPNFEKSWVVINDCTGGFSVTVKTSAGSGVTLTNGERAIAVSDATDVLGGKLKGSNTTTPLVDAKTYGASMTFDLAVGEIGTVTLTGDPTIAFSNGVNGQVYTLRLKQDGTGTRIVTWDAAVRFSTDLPEPALTTAINLTDYLSFRYNSDGAKYDLVAINRGF